MRVEIVPVETRRLREEFIRLPWTIYADDPNWVPPLLTNERKRIGPVGAHDPHRARRRLWIARINGKTVGRISAQLTHGTGSGSNGLAGHFGWIEAVDSALVFQALFAIAEDWLREHGAHQCIGPFNFSINEECGVLVDGFDTPPMIMMPHSRPSYAGHLEQLGYAKQIDLVAYRFDTRTPLPPRVERLRKRATEDPAVTLRPLDYRRFQDEIRTVLDLFNDAWSGNWGFEPFSENEISEMANMLKPVLPPAAVCIAEYQGRPAAFALGFPNLNEMIRDLNGRLFPLGWAKLLFRLKFGRYGSGRLALMGVRREFQSSPMGAALAVAVIGQLRAACREHAVHDAELSWVLETNRPVRSIIEAFGAQPYKTYRIFSRQL